MCARLVSAGIATLVIALMGCGSGGGDAVVAEVEHARITRAELASWMSTLAHSDFTAHTDQPVPSGLVSEPIDTDSCLRAVRAVAARAASKPPTPPTLAQRRRKCEELHKAVQLQALSHLITYRWRLAEARRRGVVVSDREVEHRLSQIRAERAHEPGGLTAYLHREGRSSAQQRLEAKLELTIYRYSVLLSKGSQQQQLAAFFRAAGEAEPANRSATRCSPGYAVVQECPNYVRQQAGLPSPAVLIEQIIKGA